MHPAIIAHEFAPARFTPPSFAVSRNQILGPGALTRDKLQRVSYAKWAK
jgi:hypothetical protein